MPKNDQQQPGYAIVSEPRLNSAPEIGAAVELEQVPPPQGRITRVLPLLHTKLLHDGAPAPVVSNVTPKGSSYPNSTSMIRRVSQPRISLPQRGEYLFSPLPATTHDHAYFDCKAFVEKLNSTESKTEKKHADEKNTPKPALFGEKALAVSGFPPGLIRSIQKATKSNPDSKINYGSLILRSGNPPRMELIHANGQISFKPIHLKVKTTNRDDGTHILSGLVLQDQRTFGREGSAHFKQKNVYDQKFPDGKKEDKRYQFQQLKINLSDIVQHIKEEGGNADYTLEIKGNYLYLQVKESAKNAGVESLTMRIDLTEKNAAAKHIDIAKISPKYNEKRQALLQLRDEKTIDGLNENLWQHLRQHLDRSFSVEYQAKTKRKESTDDKSIYVPHAMDVSHDGGGFVPLKVAHDMTQPSGRIITGDADMFSVGFPVQLPAIYNKMQKCFAKKDPYGNAQSRSELRQILWLASILDHKMNKPSDSKMSKSTFMEFVARCTSKFMNGRTYKESIGLLNRIDDETIRESFIKMIDNPDCSPALKQRLSFELQQRGSLNTEELVKMQQLYFENSGNSKESEEFITFLQQLADEFLGEANAEIPSWHPDSVLSKLTEAPDPGRLRFPDSIGVMTVYEFLTSLRINEMMREEYPYCGRILHHGPETGNPGKLSRIEDLLVLNGDQVMLLRNEEQLLAMLEYNDYVYLKKNWFNMHPDWLKNPETGDRWCKIYDKQIELHKDRMKSGDSPKGTVPIQATPQLAARSKNSEKFRADKNANGQESLLKQIGTWFVHLFEEIKNFFSWGTSSPETGTNYMFVSNAQMDIIGEDAGPFDKVKQKKSRESTASLASPHATKQKHPSGEKIKSPHQSSKTDKQITKENENVSTKRNSFK